MPDDDGTTQPGAPSFTTILSALAELADMGYTADMQITPEARVVCGVCHHDTAPEDLQLDEMYRLEGASDPADMAAVLGLTCTACGAQGAAIIRFGPEAEAQDNIVLRAVGDERFR